MLYINNNKNIFKVCTVLILLMVSTILISFFYGSFNLERSQLEAFTLVNWLLISISLAYLLPKGIWSISFTFFICLSIFHGGLVFISAIDMITDKQILGVIKYWFPTQQTTYGIYLINFAFIAYAITVIVCSRSVTSSQERFSPQLIKRFHNIGGLLLILFTGIFFLVSISTGATQSYQAYLNIRSESPLINLLFIYIFLFLGLAIVCVSASYRQGFGFKYFIVFAVWGAVAFVMGLRGEVMFPFAVTAAILGRRFIPIKTLKLLIIVIALLVATVIVKNARVSGDYSQIETINPLNAVAELGSSLRTVQEVVKWRTEDFQYLYGASYWAPFERLLALILPIKRLPAMQDPRLLNIVVQKKAGPIGFSPIAEAYLNFGEKGVFLIAMILGVIFSVLDNTPSSIRNDTIIGVSIIPLFIMIRNSFTFVPVQIIMGIIFAIIILNLSKVNKIQ